MKHSVLLLLLARSVLSAGASEQPLVRLEQSIDAMGSSWSVAVYGRDQVRLRGAVEQSFEEVRRLDGLLSHYRPRSEWSEMNNFAAERPVRVSEELFTLLSGCLEYSRRSEGAFDISVGPLMKLWGFYKGSGRLPHRAELRGVLGKVGYRHILLDAEERTVRFARPGVSLDPGGIGKGYTVDRMVKVLQENGIASALVSASGSSIYALGTPPGEPGWRVRIRDPKNAGKTVEEVLLKDESMSTSGTYEKFFRARGALYSHIMDPRTGYPAQGMLSVSVIAPQTIDSEAWTKPFFINGRTWAAQHKPKGYRVFLCEDRLDQACAWLQ
jgi:thiamine biosynthesis lipoprotein